MHLEIDKNAKPTVMPPRRVPIAIKPKVKQELERPTAREAITPVQEPTDWVSNMITTIKPDGSIRLCIDTHYLNQELKRSHYRLPVIDDILPDLSKVKVFSKADLQEGFLQVSLDEASSRLTTFQTPWGRYRWLRMPFGISPAPEVFQMKLHQNLEGLPGIFTIADDNLITGQGDTVQEAEEDHDNLAKFLSNCREQNIKLKKEKFKYKCEEVQFMGHCLTNEGLKPDPQKVDAILKIGTRSVHVGSLSEVSQDTPNYNCTLLSIVTMLNTLHDRYFAGYAQTQANYSAMFDVCKGLFFK